jgi:hypothetical protein
MRPVDEKYGIVDVVRPESGRERGLLADESIPGPCIAVLRSVGYDVLRARRVRGRD